MGVSIFTRGDHHCEEPHEDHRVGGPCRRPRRGGAHRIRRGNLVRRPDVGSEGQSGSDYLGTLDVASPVTVLEKKNGMAKVRIDGWSLKEYPSQIFQEAGLRIEYASFDEEKAVKLNAKGGEEDRPGERLAEVLGRRLGAGSVLTKDLDALWKAGAARHADACSSCHGAPKPEHFTANQWSSQLPVRGGRTGHTRRGNNALMFKWLQAQRSRCKAAAFLPTTEHIQTTDTTVGSTARGLPASPRRGERAGGRLSGSSPSRVERSPFPPLDRLH